MKLYFRFEPLADIIPHGLRLKRKYLRRRIAIASVKSRCQRASQNAVAISPEAFCYVSRCVH
jgi:hypothetical protein